MVGGWDGLLEGMTVGNLLGKVDGDTLGSIGCIVGIFEGASNDGTMDGLHVGNAIDGF